jgi:hypothetical protein
MSPHRFPKGVLSTPKPILPGQHLSPGTEFKPGLVPENKLPVGSVTVRQSRGDSERAWVKVAEPNEWMPRAVWVWIQHAGPVPAGFIVHHIDEDTLNDDITNLACVIRAGHMHLHREQFATARRGKTLEVKRVMCSSCHGSYDAKYQRKDALCDECRTRKRRERSRRYKERLRGQA